ncbi:glycosyltransferase family A protein [Flavobacterium sp. 14A]|uniref:glycosyltransferase family 2 protein n=1 Tax=Flavobacterium sp. 14A TaxID=2735896 RepID=UPI00156FC92C|nr:glycosyltransferase involved in cell wall biosynthesis [Flavobacterium sp. 14A]
MNKLVSIITPCYNGATFIHRLLDSVLNQTYSNIEMFIIDDGSTDDSARIIQRYISKFESKGYTLKYIYQENSGQSVAVNRGLKLFNGEYLTWPDSDDFYASTNAIKEMAEALQESCEEVSVVRCSANLLDEYTLGTVGFLGANVRDNEKVSLFDDAVFENRNFWFQPISYMVKSKFIFELITNRDIYTQKDAGQNWQILLPLFYNKQCLILKATLCNVLVRANSHSKGSYNTFEKISIRNYAHEQTLLNTLQRIEFLSIPIKVDYLKRVEQKYYRVKFELAKRFQKRLLVIDIYQIMQANHPSIVTQRDKNYYKISHIPLLLNVIIVKNKVVNKIKRYL